MDFKNLFFDKKLVTGTAVNAWVSLVMAGACAAATVVGFIVSKDLGILGILFWILGILQVRKGLVSDTPKPAKVARVVLYADVVLLIASVVVSLMRTFSLLNWGA